MGKSKIFAKVLRSPVVFLLFFPVLFFYYDVLFHAFTMGEVFQTSTWFLLLFALAYGCLLYLLTTLFRSKTVTTILTAVASVIPAVIYLVEYFVYRKFKVLYDVNTVTSGASDALGGFQSDVISLVFSFDGLSKIFLYFLPIILFFIFRKYLNLAATGKMRIISAASAVLAYGLCIALILTSSIYGPVFSKEYNFTSAVKHFGLLTAIGLDVNQGFSDSDDVVFEPLPPAPTVSTTAPEAPTDDETTPTDPTGDETIPQATTEPEEVKVYKPHQMDLDLTSGIGSIAKLNEYVASLTPAMENEYTGLFAGKNLIFITAEAFSAELIDPELTPTLYRLATKGIQFTDYYQQDIAGTTGGEYQNVFGLLPAHGGSSFKETADHFNYMTMGSQLDRLGYYGKAFHNNSYTFYSRHLTHVNLGYSDGFMGYGNGMENYVKNTWPQSDADMFAGTLPTFIDKQPFNVYYMSVSGHSNYTLSGNYMTNKHWDRVKHLPYSDLVKGYFAANMDFEDAMTITLQMLEEKGIADDTVICIATDHFPYGLDDDGVLGRMPNLSELYGYPVYTTMQRDHSRLILWSGCLEKMDPIVVDSPTSSLDILPTLSNLFGTEYDSRLFVGRDVFSDTPALVFNNAYDWISDYGTYYAGMGQFFPKEGVTVPEGHVDAIKAQVRNKIQYGRLVLENDYFRYLFDR